MPIVPVFRLRATPADPYRRFRFSRDAHPNPNPMAGEPNPDPDSQWFVDRLAFYAWSDPTHEEREDTINRQLVPVYEFYRLGEDDLVSYRYSTEVVPPPGWISRDYVAFWMYPARTANAGAPVYVHSQQTSAGANYALSLTKELPDWTNESVLGMAAATIPVVVSVRRDADDLRRFHWSYAPSTVRITYPVTIRIMQTPRSRWRFTDLEVIDGGDGFDPPIVTDARVLVNARYANPGRDFKVRITIDTFDGPNRVISGAVTTPAGEPEARGSAAASAANDPDFVDDPPDELV